MTHIGTTKNNEAILTMTINDLMNLMLYINSAQLRYRDRCLHQALKECTEMDVKLNEIWQATKQAIK